MILLLTTVFLCLQGQSVQHILVDQFGYRPGDSKIAVIKNPKIGFDTKYANAAFNPSSLYKVINVESGDSVFEGPLAAFNGGETDEVSGDQIWWFNFTKVTTPGRYYILDEVNKEQSYPFSIEEDVYKEVLKHAVRMFYYQRAGFEKEAKYAGEEWADGASHVGPGQDTEARVYNQKDNAETARDVHGGWFDAGDYNKYTPWAGSYVEFLMQCFLENPDVWEDNYNIPESGNGVPDILDEARWGLEWLLRMVEPDGSVLCIVGEDGTFPPSATKGPSYYGPSTSVATWSATKAFALSSIVFRQLGDAAFAERLEFAAIRAWNWAEANPDVKFHNNNRDYNSSGLGSGDQEVDEPHDRLTYRLAAALYIYQLTKDAAVLAVFEENYKDLPLFAWSNYVSEYSADDQYMFLQYLRLDGGAEVHKAAIRDALRTAWNKPEDFAGQIGKSGYLSHMQDYNWGSNHHISNVGAQFYLYAISGIEPENEPLFKDAAAGYLHYIHGVNPLGLVYLTNMNKYGATRSLTAIFHTWYSNSSAVWSQVTDTTPGPAPGYLGGGANQFYTWDGCCPDSCGSAENNAGCYGDDIPVDDPPSKFYRDRNWNWPLDSWALSEPMGAYQVSYLRLLSKFVSRNAGIKK